MKSIKSSIAIVVGVFLVIASTGCGPVEKRKIPKAKKPVAETKKAEEKLKVDVFKANNISKTKLTYRELSDSVYAELNQYIAKSKNPLNVLLNKQLLARGTKVKIDPLDWQGPWYGNVLKGSIQSVALKRAKEESFSWSMNVPFAIRSMIGNYNLQEYKLTNRIVVGSKFKYSIETQDNMTKYILGGFGKNNTRLLAVVSEYEVVNSLLTRDFFKRTERHVVTSKASVQVIEFVGFSNSQIVIKEKKINKSIPTKSLTGDVTVDVEKVIPSLRNKILSVVKIPVKQQ